MCRRAHRPGKIKMDCVETSPAAKNEEKRMFSQAGVETDTRFKVTHLKREVIGLSIC